MAETLKWIARAGIVVALVWSLVILATMAGAHSWYDPACCSDRDCARVNASLEPDGSLRVNLGPGRSMSLPPGYPYRPSRDLDYHLCIIKGTVICAYAPANS